MHLTMAEQSMMAPCGTLISFSTRILQGPEAGDVFRSSPQFVSYSIFYKLGS